MNKIKEFYKSLKLTVPCSSGEAFMEYAFKSFRVGFPEKIIQSKPTGSYECSVNNCKTSHYISIPVPAFSAALSVSTVSYVYGYCSVTGNFWHH